MTSTTPSQPPVNVDAVEAIDSAIDSKLDAVAGRLDGPEIANSITHGLGLALSLMAAAVILVAAAGSSTLLFLACAVYAASMVSVYFASTASHLFWQPRANHFFRMLDQGCIYLFIAGTFTPIAAAFLTSSLVWIPITMWAIAAFGFISKMFFSHRIYRASVAIPVSMGWLPILGGRSLLDVIPAGLFWWMLAGGVCYTVGTIFLMNDVRHRYLHAIWHLFVIAGTACHFWAILRYAIPAA
jgi:hemolysin III